MIDFKDITVVVQGAVSPELTPVCLQSVRHKLPGAGIILSTWEGTDVSGLDCDTVILNKDPGAVAPMYSADKNLGNKPNNINRQIVSTKAGLEKVTTKYALKLRTDFEIRETGFLQHFDKYPKSGNEMKIFSHRIVTVLGDKPAQKMFFPYDFISFGLAKDMLLLWDVPLQTKTDAEWFLSHRPVNEEMYKFIQGNFRYIPEQHIWLSCLSKKFPQVYETIEDCSDVTEKGVKLTEQSFANNLICLDFKQYGIHPLKDSLFWLYGKEIFHVQTYEEWLSLYQKYCDPDFKMPLRFCYEELLQISRYKEKFYKHRYALAEKKKLKNKLGEGLKCFSYSLLIFFKSLSRLHKIIFR